MNRGMYVMNMSQIRGRLPESPASGVTTGSCPGRAPASMPQTFTPIPGGASAAPAEPEHEQGARAVPAGPASLGMARQTAPIPVSAPLNVPMMPLAKSLSTALSGCRARPLRLLPLLLLQGFPPPNTLDCTPQPKAVKCKSSSNSFLTVTIASWPSMSACWTGPCVKMCRCWSVCAICASSPRISTNGSRCVAPHVTAAKAGDAKPVHPAELPLADGQGA